MTWPPYRHNRRFMCPTQSRSLSLQIPRRNYYIECDSVRKGSHPCLIKTLVCESSFKKFHSCFHVSKLSNRDLFSMLFGKKNFNCFGLE